MTFEDFEGWQTGPATDKAHLHRCAWGRDRQRFWLVQSASGLRNEVEGLNFVTFQFLE
jgi:hypothetical protein